jgi:PleD family two-component response regulator
MVQSLNSPGVFFGMGIGLFLLAGGLGWQFNRIKQRRKARRLQQQGLFADLQQANDRSEQLHTELAREVEQRRVVEARVRHLSQFDELTGLANRSLFKERLEEASQRARQGVRNLTLLHINLDRFKLLNDNSWS